MGLLYLDKYRGIQLDSTWITQKLKFDFLLWTTEIPSRESKQLTRKIFLPYLYRHLHSFNVQPKIFYFLWVKLWGIFLQNFPHNLVDSIVSCFLAWKLSSSLPHRLNSTGESLLLNFIVILLCNYPDIRQDDKGNESPKPRAAWSSMSKQIKEVKKPDPHSLVINRKTEEEETDCQGQDGTQIEFSSWPLKMMTFSSAHHFYKSFSQLAY